MPEDPASKAARRTVRIGKYTVVSHIATGGMGAVYKAYDTDTEREVALKVLMPAAATQPHLQERFRREARAAAKLFHPNIVTVYDFGEDHGTPYLVLEFVDGIDLHAYIEQKGALPPDEALGFIVQACRALDHAHRHGIIHRDVKPSNFLVTVRDGKRTLKMTDLGLAREVEADDFRVTREGTTVGTVDYMAPEQARDSNLADVRSDLYSLGSTWFFLLTMRPPFPKGGLGERLLKIMSEDAPDVRSFNPAVSAPMAAVLNRLLAKHPANRYQTAADLLRDLDRLRRGTLEVLETIPEPEPELQPLTPPAAITAPPPPAPVAAGPPTPRPLAPPPDTAVNFEAEVSPPSPDRRPRRRRRQQPRDAQQAQRRFFAVAATVGVVVVVGLIAFFVRLGSLADDAPAPPEKQGAGDLRPPDGNEPGPWSPALPEIRPYHGGDIDLDRDPDIAGLLKRQRQSAGLATRIVLRLSGSGEYRIPPISVSGCSLVLQFQLPRANAVPVVLRPVADTDAEVLIHVDNGDLEIVGGGLRLGEPAPARLAWLVKVRGGDLNLSGCRLEGLPGAAVGSYRGLLSFAGIGVGGQGSRVRSCRLQRGIFVSGRDGLAVEGAGVRLEVTGSVLAVAGAGIDLQPGADVQCRLERTTVAARTAVVHFGSGKAGGDVPAQIETGHCAFLSPFRAEARQAGLLLYEDDALPLGRLTWHSEDDLYDCRLHFGAAHRPPEDVQPLERWVRLWGLGNIRGAVLKEGLRTTLGTGLQPLDRLALPPNLAGQHGADLEALGIKQ